MKIIEVKKEDEIHIGGDINIKVLGRTGRDRFKLGVTAPQEKNITHIKEGWDKESEDFERRMEVAKAVKEFYDEE